MKTITDAVNEFKGEWPDHNSLSRGDSVLILQHKCDKNLTNGATGYCEATYRLISTEFEFLECIRQLTGCPVKLKQWQDSKMNKAIKDAYEDLNGVLPCYAKQKFLFIDTDDDEYVMFYTRNHEDNYTYVCTVKEFNDYKKCKEEVKPVYTKAMQDAGELPSVGELVQIGNKDGSYTDFFNGKLVHVKYKKLWISDDKHGDRIVNFGDVIFQPIDTRTDKEKAIDAELVSCTGYTDDIRNALSNAYDKWVK